MAKNRVPNWGLSGSHYLTSSLDFNALFNVLTIDFKKTDRCCHGNW